MNKKRQILVAGMEHSWVGVKRPISVTFDTNVIENVVIEDRAKKEGLDKIYHALKLGNILGHVVYTYFVHDAIKKGIRIDMLRDEMEVRIPSNPLLYRKGMGMKFVQMAVVPPDSFTLGTVEALRTLNMKVLDFRRAFWPTTSLCLPILEPPSDYNEKAKAIQAVVENEFHCGFYRFREYLKKTVGKNGDDFSLLCQLDKSEQGNAFNNAYAEAADGDAITAHYGYGIDLFCTDDRAKDGNRMSVFSAKHKNILNKRFGIKFISSSELADMLAEGGFHG